MSSLDNLWRLQEIRKTFFELKKREQAILNSGEVKTIKEKLSDVQKKYDLLNLKIQGIERDIKKREMDCRALEEKKRKLQQEQYSGNANAKELAAIQQCLEQTENEYLAAEEDMLGLSEELEVLNKDAAFLHREISELEGQLGVLQANLEVELQELRYQITEAKKAHKAVLKNIDTKTLNVYNKKFNRYTVTTVAKVSGGLCLGCKVHLPRYLIAEVKKNALVGCENCGRILYYPTKEELKA